MRTISSQQHKHFWIWNSLIHYPFQQMEAHCLQKSTLNGWWSSFSLSKYVNQFCFYLIQQRISSDNQSTSTSSFCKVVGITSCTKLIYFFWPENCFNEKGLYFLLDLFHCCRFSLRLNWSVLLVSGQNGILSNFIILFNIVWNVRVVSSII